MKSNLFLGRYLFHFHTTLTDGRLSVKDYFDFVMHRGVDSLIFLEHIRKKPTYDVEGLHAETKQLAQETGVRTLLGFEAKLLPGGELDIDEQFLQKAEIIGIAEHGFPNDCGLLRSSFLRALDRYPRDLPEKTFVWVHPGLWFQTRGIDLNVSTSYWDMLHSAQDSGVLIERNLRYGLVGDNIVSRISSESIVVGADAHTARDLEVWESVQ